MKIYSILFFCFLVLMSCSNQKKNDKTLIDKKVVQSEIQKGTIKDISFYSNNLKRNWNFSIYLPSKYGVDSSKFDVLYLLHGHGGNEKVWMSSGEVKMMIDSMIYKHEIDPIVIVMPDGGNSWFVDGVEKMESALIKDLLPKIESNYRVNNNWKHRMIGGMSAGGYGSLRLILKYPELFQTAILMSPAAYVPYPDQISLSRTEVQSFKDQDGRFSNALWDKYNYPNYWVHFDSSNYSPHRFFLSTGTSDVFKGIIKSVNYQLPQELRKRKLKVSFYVQNYKGGHEMIVWKQALKDALLKIYSN